MKINITIDVTPEEVRRLYGLPDVKDVRNAMLDMVKEQIGMGIKGIPGDELLKPLVETGFQSMELFQRMFFGMLSHMKGETASASESTKKKSPPKKEKSKD